MAAWTMLRPHRVPVPTMICAKGPERASSSRCPLAADPASRRPLDADARSSNRQRTRGYGRRLPRRRQRRSWQAPGSRSRRFALPSSGTSERAGMSFHAKEERSRSSATSTSSTWTRSTRRARLRSETRGTGTSSTRSLGIADTRSGSGCDRSLPMSHVSEPVDRLRKGGCADEAASQIE